MDDICNVVFLRFRDVTKRASVRTLYREPLGEIVVYYDNVYKNQKGVYAVLLNPYEHTFVCIKDFWSAFLLEVIFHRYKAFTYCCYLMIPCPKRYEQRLIF